jgi:putative IMPACT (imprinted ancient) family translation regulator
MRAYGDAADAALDRAPIAEKVVRVPVRIRFAYDDTTPARRVVQRFDATVTDSDYTDVTELTVGVRASEVDAFVEAFTNALSARGEVLEVGGGERGEEA